jgi:hypothetical protein
MSLRKEWSSLTEATLFLPRSAAINKNKSSGHNSLFSLSLLGLGTGSISRISPNGEALTAAHVARIRSTPPETWRPGIAEQYTLQLDHRSTHTIVFCSGLLWTVHMRKKTPDSSGKSFSHRPHVHRTRKEPKTTLSSSRCQRLVIYAPARILTYAFGFCGVPSTREIGPFIGCVWVVVELLATASDSTFTPSFRRPLNTLDMLTSR